MSERLRLERELRGWTQERLAEEIHRRCTHQWRRRGEINRKMISRWEQGKFPPSRYYQEALCSIFGLNAQQLGFSQTPLAPQPYQDDTTLPLGGYMDRKRRQLLQTMSIAWTALALPIDIDIERVVDASARPAHQDAALIESLDAINRNQWTVYRATTRKTAVLDAVAGQLESLIQFVKDASSPTLRRSLYGLISDLAQLTGEIFFDANDHASARSCYHLAAQTAKEAEHYDLWACALIRQSFLFLYGDQVHRNDYHDALPLLAGADRLVKRGDSQLTTRYWTHAVLAEAQSGAQNLTACHHSLDIAAAVKGSQNGGWLRYDGDRLQELRGACFVRLNEPDIALPVLSTALAEHPSPTRRRGMVLIDLATTMLQRRDVEGSCTYAQEALTIMNQQTSGFLRKGLLQLQAQLEPYATSNSSEAIQPTAHRITQLERGTLWVNKAG